jgi:hypothetical protein
MKLNFVNFQLTSESRPEKKEFWKRKQWKKLKLFCHFKEQQRAESKKKQKKNIFYVHSKKFMLRVSKAVLVVVFLAIKIIFRLKLPKILVKAQ